MTQEERKKKIDVIEKWLSKARTAGTIDTIDSSVVCKDFERLVSAALKREPVKAWRVSSAPTKGGWGPYWDFVRYEIRTAKNRRRVVVVAENNRDRRIRVLEDLLYKSNGNMYRLVSVVHHLVVAFPGYCDRHAEVDQAINLAYEVAILEKL